MVDSHRKCCDNDAPSPPHSDDHALFACSLEALLEPEDSVEVVGVAQDGLEAVELAAALEPDFVLLDVAMPRLNGYQAAERIRKRNPGTGIVMVTGAEESARRSGKVVLKDDVGEALLPAIRAEAPT